VIPHALLRRSQTRTARPAPRRRLTRLASALLLPVAASGLVAPAAQVATAVPAAAATSPSPWLPFDLPAKATLQSSPHKVFANWVSSMPISVDNKPPATDYFQRNYLAPTGEGGRHAAYGGYMRDRALGRAPVTGDWKFADMKTEVRQALSEGIDGFTVVIYTLPPAGKTDALWENVKLMMRAAAAVDPNFKIVPMPDTSGWSKLRFVAPGVMALRMGELAKYPAAYKIGGKMVLSPFTAENLSPTWWSGVMNTMAKTYGAPVAFMPTVQNDIKWRAAFAPITYGMGNWGVRNPQWNNPALTFATSPVGRIGAIHKQGDKWMQPVSVQDERPRNGMYWEAANTQNLRNSWQIAFKGKADWIQLTTWNDMPEGSGMLPSTQHGWSFLDINAYYLSWFKTGVAPTIKRDAVYLTHRKQPLAAKPTFKQQTMLMKHAGGTPGRDTVEALTFSKAAGTVRIVVGSKTYNCAVKAGVDVCTVPLGTGKVSAKLIRGSATVAGLTSPYPVTSAPLVQDFQYVGSGSLRQGTTASTPAPAPQPVAATSSSTLAPTADGYANAASPSTSYGTRSSLVAQGTPAATSYLRFTLPKAPAGKTLKAATLTVRTTNSANAGSAKAATVKLAGNGWTEAGLTWANRPAVSGATLGSLAAPKANAVYTATLSATALRPALGKQVTVAVTGADGLWFWSRNHAAATYRPRLVLTFG
jgi:hypothetical protein